MRRPANHVVGGVRVTPPALRAHLRGELGPTVVSGHLRSAKRLRLRSVEAQTLPQVAHRPPIARNMLPMPRSPERGPPPQHAPNLTSTSPGLAAAPTAHPTRPDPTCPTLPFGLVDGPVHRVSVTVAVTAHRSSLVTGNRGKKWGEKCASARSRGEFPLVASRPPRRIEAGTGALSPDMRPSLVPRSGDTERSPEVLLSVYSCQTGLLLHPQPSRTTRSFGPALLSLEDRRLPRQILEAIRLEQGVVELAALVGAHVDQRRIAADFSDPAAQLRSPH
jgi:hypothetical protein